MLRRTKPAKTARYGRQDGGGRAGPAAGGRKYRALSDTPTAIRKRLQRRRKDDGELVVTLVLDDDLIEGLIGLHWFGEWDREDADAVAKALIEGLREAVGHA